MRFGWRSGSTQSDLLADEKKTQEQLNVSVIKASSEMAYTTEHPDHNVSHEGRNLGNTNMLDLSLAVSQKAQEREDRLAAGEVRMTEVVIKEREEYKQDFRNICLEAAELGKLTRLKEHIIEAVATEKTAEEEWASRGVMAHHTAVQSQQRHRLVIQEAARKGRKTKLQEIVVANYNTKKTATNSLQAYEKERVNQEMMNQVGTAHLKMDEIIRRNKKVNDTKEYEDINDLLDEEDDHVVRPRFYYESLNSEQINNITLPRNELPKLYPHQKMIEIKELQAKQNEKKKDGAAVWNEEKPLSNISNQVAQRARARVNRLNWPGSVPRVKEEGCQCPYCANASPFQTFAYKEKARLKKEAEIAEERRLIEEEARRQEENRMEQERLEAERIALELAVEEQQQMYSIEKLKDDQLIDEKSDKSLGGSWSGEGWGNFSASNPSPDQSGMILEDASLSSHNKNNQRGNGSRSGWMSRSGATGRRGSILAVFGRTKRASGGRTMKSSNGDDDQSLMSDFDGASIMSGDSSSSPTSNKPMGRRERRRGGRRTSILGGMFGHKEQLPSIQDVQDIQEQDVSIQPKQQQKSYTRQPPVQRRPRHGRRGSLLGVFGLGAKEPKKAMVGNKDDTLAVALTTAVMARTERVLEYSQQQQQLFGDHSKRGDEEGNIYGYDKDDQDEDESNSMLAHLKARSGGATSVGRPSEPSTMPQHVTSDDDDNDDDDGMLAHLKARTEGARSPQRLGKTAQQEDEGTDQRKARTVKSYRSQKSQHNHGDIDIFCHDTSDVDSGKDSMLAHVQPRTVGDTSAKHYVPADYKLGGISDDGPSQVADYRLSDFAIENSRGETTYGDAARDSATDNDYGYGDAAPDSATTFDYGYENAAPDSAIADDYGYEIAANGSATAGDYGYGHAAPDSAIDDYGYEQAAPDSATDDGYGYELAAPDSATDDMRVGSSASPPLKEEKKKSGRSKHKKKGAWLSNSSNRNKKKLKSKLKDHGSDKLGSTSSSKVPVVGELKQKRRGSIWAVLGMSKPAQPEAESEPVSNIVVHQENPPSNPAQLPRRGSIVSSLRWNRSLNRGTDPKKHSPQSSEIVLPSSSENRPRRGSLIASMGWSRHAPGKQAVSGVGPFAEIVIANDSARKNGASIRPSSTPVPVPRRAHGKIRDAARRMERRKSLISETVNTSNEHITTNVKIGFESTAVDVALIPHGRIETPTDAQKDNGVKDEQEGKVDGSFSDWAQFEEEKPKSPGASFEDGGVKACDNHEWQAFGLGEGKGQLAVPDGSESFNRGSFDIDGKLQQSKKQCEHETTRLSEPERPSILQPTDTTSADSNPLPSSETIESLNPEHFSHSQTDPTKKSTYELTGLPELESPSIPQLERKTSSNSILSSPSDVIDGLPKPETVSRVKTDTPKKRIKKSKKKKKSKSFVSVGGSSSKYHATTDLQVEGTKDNGTLSESEADNEIITNNLVGLLEGVMNDKRPGFKAKDVVSLYQKVDVDVDTVEGSACDETEHDNKNNNKNSSVKRDATEGEYYKSTTNSKNAFMNDKQLAGDVYGEIQGAEEEKVRYVSSNTSLHARDEPSADFSILGTSAMQTEIDEQCQEANIDAEEEDEQFEESSVVSNVTRENDKKKSVDNVLAKQELEGPESRPELVPTTLVDDETIGTSDIDDLPKPAAVSRSKTDSSQKKTKKSKKTKSSSLVLNSNHSSKSMSKSHHHHQKKRLSKGPKSGLEVSSDHIVHGKSQERELPF